MQLDGWGGHGHDVIVISVDWHHSDGTHITEFKGSQLHAHHNAQQLQHRESN